jgi:hypothetical protein
LTDFTPAQQEAIDIAHELVELGAPIFVAARNHGDIGMEFHLPSEWQHWKPSHQAVDRWRPGMALGMVTGVVFDAIDIDPRNGGNLADLADARAVPVTWGEQATPSAGRHLLITPTGLAKGKPTKGIDLQAGKANGEGRGFIYLAPTERVSKFGERAGQSVPYVWVERPVMPGEPDTGHANLVGLIGRSRPVARVGSPAVKPAVAAPDDPFDLAEDWTAAGAEAAMEQQLARVSAAREGEVNEVLGGAARLFGRFVAGGFVDEDEAATLLLEALEVGGVHSDEWNRANRKDWTAAGVIASAFANAQAEPWTVAPVAPSAPVRPAAAVPGVEVDTSVASGQWPRLLIESPAIMAYWLAQEVGQGRLAGFFSRGGQVVHTPQVSELGYVPAPDGGQNGPAEIRPVTQDTLAAKLQFLYACYKVKKGKGEEPDAEVPAMFPTAAAKAVVNAPEAATGLRPLLGITHTPMVRADGSILTEPGYDKASGYLFLPGPGVNVPAVPERPTLQEVQAAVALLGEMAEGFPFAGDDDRANYYGLLLTPLLRLVTPPSYKMFGIGAHQPGSGKSLLAETVALVHGAVTRAETPEDEAEWRKMTMSLLATTSAPVVVLDNVTGVLKSSTLAGLLTSSGEIQDRELGSSRMITTSNDRCWVVTGNNLSLGGDLVRRTITILIDPNMANPETRMGFKIQDLPSWVKVNRNRILQALLIMIRHWVGSGMPLEARKQSDGFATWERAVGGILAAASVPGRFDAESGKRAAAGGDDDGLATLLERLDNRFQSLSWSVADALKPEAGEMVLSDRDWLPAFVLDKLARSEASGRQSFGKWLRFRIGRWVTGSDGRAYVLREAGRSHSTTMWQVEVRG